MGRPTRPTCASRWPSHLGAIVAAPQEAKRDFNKARESNLYFSLYLILFLYLLQVNAPVVSIDGHENVPVNNEDALLKAVVNQPVSVAIEAGGPDFQFYSEVVPMLTHTTWTFFFHKFAMIRAIKFGPILSTCLTWSQVIIETKLAISKKINLI